MIEDIKAPKGITAANLQGKNFPPVRWVVEGHIPQGLTLLAGKPKGGKSWLMLATAIAVAHGRPAFTGSECAQGDVLYAALEDTERRLQDRMTKLLGNSPWPARLTFWPTMKPIEEGGAEELKEWFQAHPDARLAIIDVVGRVRGKRRNGETLYDGDYRTIAALKTIADETGVAIIVVHHVRKMRADDPLDAVSGTTGLAGAADTILVLTRETAGVTLHGRGRDIEEIEVAMEFDKETCRWRVLGPASAIRMSRERAMIIEALGDGGVAMTPAQISAVTGQTGVNVRRLVTKMARNGELNREGKGKYRLP